MITVCHPSATVNGAQDAARVAFAARTTKRVHLPVATLFAVLAAVCATPTLRAETLQPLRVAAGVYVLRGSGGEISPDNGGRTANVAFVVGPRGVVVVNTGISYAEGEAIIAAVARISKRPIRLAILTHPGQEAIFGAAAFKARGIPILAARQSAELIASRCETCLTNLRRTLGEEAMENTRVVLPDRLIEGGQTLDLIGRPLRLIVPPWSSAPGALAVFDVTSATLVTGSLVSIERIPDLRDAHPQAWRAALVELEATACRHLVPGYGQVGTCEDVAAFAQYFDALERRVADLQRQGVGLAELNARSDLPAFARWDQYDTLNGPNANRTYLRLEQEQLRLQ
jgi:glyoxylase-like metal-dependent hydrolase (beta-lactamase superfamily II)